MSKRKIIILLFMPIFLSCNGQDKTFISSNIHGYNFQEPEVFELPDLLEEISGLSAIDEQTLATVQDEEGILILYSLEEKKIVKQIEFGGEGDYEGVEVGEKDAFVLESSGIIYHIKDYLSDNFSVETIETGLKKKFDAEGLCVDEAKQTLIIACKEYTDKSNKDKKTIFGYDLQQRSLKDPFLTIKLEKLAEKLITDPVSELSFNLNNIIKDEDISELFKPSGIALHPVTGSYFVLSAQNKLMAITDNKGNILQVIDFGEKLMHQPEGITFSSDGTLYISNEGKSGKPNILRYHYNENNDKKSNP